MIKLAATVHYQTNQNDAPSIKAIIVNPTSNTNITHMTLSVNIMSVPHYGLKS